MKRKTIKKTLLTLGMASMLCFVIQTTSNAGVQSKPGADSYTDTANNLFINIRKMETNGGTLGLNAELEATTYLDKTKNGIDIHMAKNTEWGTAAMLAASPYGTRIPDYKAQSTTGNNSGIFHFASNRDEYVAGIYKNGNDYTNTITQADSRYFNAYNSTFAESYKIGDATYELKAWGKEYYELSTTNPIPKRINSSFLGFQPESGNKWYNNGKHYFTARAAIVNGEDL